VLLILEVRLQRVVPRFYSSILLQAPKGHYLELNFIMESSYLTPCIDDEYIEVRDGYNWSANLLGVFCGRNISVIVRSIEPNLDKVAKTQFVLFNQTSSLWCPAQGAPAPFIVWRKNGIMVQNSTSVKYKLTITEENNNKYSCEVKTQDGFDKGEIRLVVERCPDPCPCKIAVGTIGAATLIECSGKHLLSVPRHLPFSTIKLGGGKGNLNNNQTEQLLPKVFHNNSRLVVLALNDNQIKELPPVVFNNNIELIELALNDNQIKELPPGVFNNNTELMAL
ncbi:unnamed protein product, partial [Pocillopora meandrina]